MTQNKRTIDNILLSGYIRESEEEFSMEIPDLVTYIICMFCKEYLIQIIGLQQSNKPNINRMLNLLKDSYLDIHTIDNSHGVQINKSNPLIQIAPDITDNINEQIIDIQSSSKHTLFLTINGNVYGYGNNESGQLGLGKNINRSHIDTPTLISFEYKIKAIACGELHSLFINEHGTLLVCGYNYCGQLGMDVNTEPIKEPLTPDCSEIETPTYDNNNDDDYIYQYECVYIPMVNTYFNDLGIKLMYIGCGSHHSICITTNGDCYTFGHNGYGNLGNGKHTEYGTGLNIPYKLVDINKKFKAVSCGQNYNILLTENNEIVVFGNNMKNQCSIVKQIQFDDVYVLSKEIEFGVSENAFVEKVICMKKESVSIVVIDEYKRV